MSTAFAVSSAEQREERTPRGFPRWTAGVLLLWALSGVYLVQPDQQAVVVRFGGMVESRVPPGLHYALPWPVDQVHKLKVRQTRRLTIGGELADGVLGQSQPLASQFITGDQNIINMNVVVQYSVADPVLFLFHSTDVAAVIGAIAESELALRVGHVKVDDVLTTEKVALQNAVRIAAQRELDAYRSGVVLAGVNISSVTPPAEAADAFRDVASARADAIRTVNEAEGYANALAPRSRGEAVQIVESARAYKDSRVNRANGDAARFSQVVEEYRKAPDVTSKRAYVEAMEEILPRLKKTIVDSNGPADLTIVRKNDSAPPKSNP